MPRTESLIDLAARVKNLRDTRLANDQCAQCGKAQALDPSPSTWHCAACWEKKLVWNGRRPKRAVTQQALITSACIVAAG